VLYILLLYMEFIKLCIFFMALFQHWPSAFVCPHMYANKQRFQHTQIHPHGLTPTLTSPLDVRGFGLKCRHRIVISFEPNKLHECKFPECNRPQIKIEYSVAFEGLDGPIGYWEWGFEYQNQAAGKGLNWAQPGLSTVKIIPIRTRR